MSGKYTKTDVGDVARNMIWRERIIKEQLARLDALEEFKKTIVVEEKEKKQYSVARLLSKDRYTLPEHTGDINPYNIEEGLFTAGK